MSVTSAIRNPYRAATFASVLMLVFAAGCAAHHAYLVPAPTANLAQRGHAAVAEDAKVSVEVTPNSWNGKPADLPNRVTPLKVSIRNHSSHPLRLTYDDFALRTQSGRLFAALPPTRIKGSEYVGENRGMATPDNPTFVESQAPRYRLAAWSGKTGSPPAAHTAAGDPPVRVWVRPGFDWDNFYPAPYWGLGYEGLEPWPYAWSPDWAYYNTYYPYMRQIHLPTQSMLSKGIPEGVVAAGGRITGFLYFAKVNPNEREVTFAAKLVDARTGRQFGHMQIPLLVKK